MKGKVIYSFFRGEEPCTLLQGEQSYLFAVGEECKHLTQFSDFFKELTDDEFANLYRSQFFHKSSIEEFRALQLENLRRQYADLKKSLMPKIHSLDDKDNKTTPLMSAVLHRNIDASRALLELKADVHAINSKELTALALALDPIIFPDAFSIVKMLVNHKADVNVLNPDVDQSLLMKVISPSYDSFIPTLLENKADVNFSNKSKMTALHIACQTRNYTDSAKKLAVIELLIAHGAKYNLQTHSPFDLLQSQNPVDQPIKDQIQAETQMLKFFQLAVQQINFPAPLVLIISGYLSVFHSPQPGPSSTSAATASVSSSLVSSGFYSASSAQSTASSSSSSSYSHF